MFDRKGKFGPAIGLFFGLKEYAKGGLGLVMTPFHVLGFLGIRFLASQAEMQSDRLRRYTEDCDNNGSWDGDWN